MIVTLEKVKELDDAVHRFHIEEGRKFSGRFISEPVVGEVFHVGGFWCTSKVEEILPDNYFRTMNSIYKYETKEVQSL